MIQSIFHTSEKGNVYLYDNQRRFSMLAHPKLKNIHESLVDDSYYSKKYLKNSVSFQSINLII